MFNVDVDVGGGMVAHDHDIDHSLGRDDGRGVVAFMMARTLTIALTFMANGSAQFEWPGT